jgi:DNA polymerase, archaea type
LQQTFKILINSFYGYLGFGFGHFNDFGRAADVTRRGRQLIQRAIRDLEDREYQVVEVDTDGIYFVAPAIYDDEPAQNALLQELGEAMPSGIRLEIDGRYPAMFSYKMKNYALLEEANTITIRGSGLRSRGLERFQRSFMEEMFRLLLEGREKEVPQQLERYQQKLELHQIGIRDLMKTETLQDSLDAYRQKVNAKRRNAAAAYELAVKSGRQYQSGDQISWYVTGSRSKVKVSDAARLAVAYDPANPNENVEYYKGKLAELFAKFKPFVDQPRLRDASSAESSEGAEQGQMFSADTEEGS